MLWVLIRIVSAEAILMSTHNIWFYGEITKTELAHEFMARFILRKLILQTAIQWG